MNIGQAARQSGVTAKMIRHYESGLALEHARELDDKIRELTEMRDLLKELAEACRGDHHPDCPILNRLSES